MLKYRILTALVLIPLVIGALFFASPFWFGVVAAAIFLGGAWEWSNLMQLKRISHRIAYLFLIAIFMGLSLLFIPPAITLGFALAWWLIATILIILYPRAADYWSKSTYWRAIMGICVLVPSFRALVFIRNQDQGNPDVGIYAILFLFIIIWGADTAAYFTGKKWGKTKLAPLVSPGKSIQGALGAILFTALITLLTLWFVEVPHYIWPWAIVLSLVTVIFSIIGDLCESMLKREAGIKDSGKLLPGHGGLLDRIDSLTAAAPIFALGATLLGIYL